MCMEKRLCKCELRSGRQLGKGVANYFNYWMQPQEQKNQMQHARGCDALGSAAPLFWLEKEHQSIINFSLFTVVLYIFLIAFFKC